jgi:hypothetical protein
VGGGEARGEASRKDTREKVNESLQVENRIKITYTVVNAGQKPVNQANHGEAGSQKKRIAGQTNEGGCAVVKAVNTLLQQAAGDTAIDERIARQVGIVVDEKQAQGEPQRKRYDCPLE